MKTGHFAALALNIVLVIANTAGAQQFGVENTDQSVVSSAANSQQTVTTKTEIDPNGASAGQENGSEADHWRWYRHHHYYRYYRPVVYYYYPTVTWRPYVVYWDGVSKDQSNSTDSGDKVTDSVGRPQQ